MIQEPYLDHLHNSQATHHWFTIYPKEHCTNPGKTRSLILINRWIATDAWSQLNMGLSDVTAIQLTTRHGKTIIGNMYNDSIHQQGLRKTVQAMRDRARRVPTANCTMPMIWISDLISTTHCGMRPGMPNYS